MPWPPLSPQPHYVFCLQWHGTGHNVGADPVQLLETMEVRVPGTLVYGKGVSTRGRYSRLSKLTDKARATLLSDPSGVTFEIHVPLNGAWLASDALDGAGVIYASMATSECQSIAPWSDADADLWEAKGRIIVESLAVAGRLREKVPAMLAPYQYEAIGFGSARPWLFTRISPGGGKTIVALVLAAALRPKGQGINRITTLVVGPAKARSVWWAQSQRFTSLLPWKLLPGDGGESLDAFVARLNTADATGIAIVGAESLPDHLDIVTGLRPQLLIFDELCSDAMAGRSGRWERIGMQDGTVGYRPKKTKGSRAAAETEASEAEDEDGSRDAVKATSRVARAYALMVASRLASVTKRIALDGTPLYEGKPRRLFNPFDCIWPAGFGFSSLPFKQRYAGAKYNGFGWDDKGASHLDELAERASFFVVDVPYSASHGALPKTRVEVIRIAKDELGAQAKGAAADVRELMAAIKSGKAKRAMLTELRLAHAAVRKHGRALSDAADVLRSGGKAALFTARHKDCERLAEVAAATIEKLTQGDAGLAEPPWFLWAHGGSHSEAQRAKMCAIFHDRPGPGMLVGTGQAFGTSFDGLQVADFAGICMLTPRLGELSQWKGRFDRRDDQTDVVATLVRIYIAEQSVDDEIIDKLSSQFPVVKALFDVGDLGDLEEKLSGLDAASVEAALDDIMENL